MSEIVYNSEDLSKTSYGLGHHWRQETSNLNIPMSLDHPLPNELNHVCEVLADDHFQTTTGSAHNMKFSRESYDNETFSKPPAHYKVHYNRDLHEKLQSGPLRRPLITGNQLSETKEEFSSKMKPFEPSNSKEFQGFELKDHLKRTKVATKDTPSKAPGNSTTSIIWLNDPYVTTYQKEHRMFDPDELHYAAQKMSAVNPLMVLPKELPMMDRIPFKDPVKIRNVPQKNNIVPHSGMKSEYKDNFEHLPSLYNKSIQMFPMSEATTELSDPTFYVPHLYKTEYQNIGSKCRQAV